MDFINAGADVIVTNTFTTRRIRMQQNQVGHQFNFANEKAGELALKAKEISKKNILIAGGLPAQSDTYQVDKREKNIIEKDFYDQATLINPYIDFFYLDVISSGKEIVTLNHEAFDRSLYSEGALLAAKWLMKNKPGLYSMRDMMNFK